MLIWCRWPESNRHGLFNRRILSPVRLPVPPHLHICTLLANKIIVLQTNCFCQYIFQKKFFDNVDSVKFYLTFLKYLCIINRGNDKPQNVVLQNRYKNSHLNRQIYRCELFYLCSCYQPSSYTELLSRQRLMLKIT